MPVPAEPRVVQVAGSISSRLGGPSVSALGLNGQLGGLLVTTDAETDPAEVEELRSAGVHVHPAGRLRRLEVSPGFLLDIHRQIPRSDLVVFHGLLLVGTLLGAALCTLRRHPYAVQLHGGLEPYQMRVHRRRKQIAGPALRAVLDHAVLVACATEDEAAKARAYAPRARVEVVGIGVDPTTATARPAPRRPVRIGYLGRFAVKKRLDLVVRGAGLFGRVADVRLVVAGQGNPAEERTLGSLLDEQRDLAAERRGPVSGAAKDQFFQDIDILLLPSDNENFAIVVAEAMAQGVPVVATRHVALQHDAVRVGAGVFCDQDPASIAAALAEVVGRYAECSAAALRFAREELSWDAVQQRWLTAAGL